MKRALIFLTAFMVITAGACTKTTVATVTSDDSENVSSTVPSPANEDGTADTDSMDSSLDLGSLFVPNMSGTSNNTQLPAGIEFSYPDELKLTDTEKDVNMILFNCGGTYMVCYENSFGYIRLYSSVPDGYELEDGEFALITADIKKAYGGVAGYMGNPYIKKIKNFQMVNFEELVDTGKILDYKSDEYLFNGARYLRSDDGTLYCIAKAPFDDFRIYKNEVFQTTFSTSLEVENATGYKVLKDPGVSLEESMNSRFYVINMEGTYYSYCDYEGMNKWTPILNEDFGNEPDNFTLDPGQTAIIRTRVVIVNGGEGGYVNVPMFCHPYEDFEIVSFDELSVSMYAKHWQESKPLVGELRRFSDNKGEYIIFRLDDGYHVYFEEYAQGNAHSLIGVYKTFEEVDELLGIN